MSQSRDFWSRRKAGVEAEARALQEAEAAPIVDERSDEEVLAELELPQPETLEDSDAVKAFLQNDLPQRLKARALRQLWRTNPIFANLDGLVDYGEDFTDAATVPEKLETVYQVGKGMLTALIEDDTPEAGDAPGDMPDEHTADEDIEDTPLIAAAEPQALPEPEPEPIATPQRRMRFAFHDA